MRRLVLALISGFALAGGPAVADSVPFQPQAFEAARAAGKPILVEVDASWCPTCAKQRPIIAKLAAEPALRDLMIMRVDFDSQKDAVQSLGARMQSTLIVFNGKDERGRAVGVTDEAEIRALLMKAKG